MSIASPKPCSACPWRIENQGKRHPGGWYTKANLRRLWARLRRGEKMTCHPTDPENPLPEGWPAPPPSATTVECCGSLVLTQREFMRYQAIMEELDAKAAAEGRGRAKPSAVLAEYKRRFGAKGMTRAGLIRVLERHLIVAPGEIPPRKPDLNLDGIGHCDLVPWTPDEAR